MLHSIPFDIVFHLITLQTHPSRHSDKSGDKFVTGFVTEIKTSAYPLTSAQLVSVLIAYAIVNRQKVGIGYSQISTKKITFIFHAHM